MHHHKRKSGTWGSLSEWSKWSRGPRGQRRFELEHLFLVSNYNRPSLQNLDLVIQSYDIHPNNSQYDFSSPLSSPKWHPASHSVVRQMVAPVWGFIQWPFWAAQRVWGNSSFKTTCRWVNTNSSWDVLKVEMGEAPSSWFAFLRLHEVFR